MQLGVDYGIANRRGRPMLAEAGAILEYARTNGIDTLDTAMAYGESESRLGALGVADWRVITKLPALPDGTDDIAAWAEDSLAGSLRRLNVHRVYGLLLHRPAQLLERNGDQIYRALQRCKARGLAEKVGVSIYDPEELGEIIDTCAIDLVQAPFSIVDRRMSDNGWLRLLAERGIEVHTRSVFLQGLLLMRPDARPATFERFQPLWTRWGAWLEENRLTPLEACLRFALSFEDISHVIVGVESLEQLAEVVRAAEGPLPDVPSTLKSDDVDLLNPSRWVAT